ncbi:MAG TPA: carboxypeptidase-like regulatory domain-containing protein, partial [Vicinamibacterales bacterium]
MIRWQAVQELLKPTPDKWQWIDDRYLAVIHENDDTHGITRFGALGEDTLHWRRHGESNNSGKKKCAHREEDARGYSRRQASFACRITLNSAPKHPVCNGDTFQEVDAMSQRIAGAVQSAALSAILLFSGHGHHVHCQELTGIISGQAVDQTDNVLPGTRVVITNLHSARVIAVTTGASGTYWVPLAPGEYAVRWEAAGFAQQEVPLVEVRPGRTVTLSAMLRVGSINERVEVTA